MVAGASILLVNNDPEATGSFAALLELEQAAVRVAPSAEQALAVLEDAPVDALIADITSPGIDGYEFIRRVRATPTLARIKAVALTALGREEDRVAAYDAGFDAQIGKPVDLPQLVRTIEMLLDVGGQ